MIIKRALTLVTHYIMDLFLIVFKHLPTQSRKPELSSARNHVPRSLLFLI
jgi:hypothetical protein